MTRITVGAIATVIAATALVFSACGDKTADTEGADTNPNGEVTGYTSCKGVSMAASRGDTADSLDCLEYDYDGQSVLRLKHVNAGFNCCPDSLMAAFQISTGEIVIDEAELLTSGGCHCLCLYDLDYEVTGLAPDQYSIRVNQPYLTDDAEILEFTLDLTAARSGTFCVLRDFYPWGTN
jgi:hypothetical protein